MLNDATTEASYEAKLHFQIRLKAKVTTTVCLSEYRDDIIEGLEHVSLVGL